jgi:hypothetical protein
VLVRHIIESQFFYYETPGEDAVHTEPAVLKLIARAWADEGFKARFLNEPAAVMAEAGIHVPEGVEVKILQDTSDVAHLVIPAKPAGDRLSEENLTKAIWVSRENGRTSNV